MDFALWDKIGTNFMVDSNIVNQFWCSPDSGSLVGWTDGTINCHIIKAVVPGTCDNVVPNEMYKLPCGFSLKRGSSVMVQVVAKHTCKPIHDQCGTGKW